MRILLLTVCFSFSVTCQDTNQTEPIDFPEAVQSGRYVDKSLMVEAFFKDPNNVVLATAPRNFGKTLNILLLKHYFQIEVDKSGNAVTDKSKTANYNLFTKLKIFKNHPFFNATFGSRPVIYVDYGTLSGVVNYETMLENTRRTLLNTFAEHKHLEHADNLWAGKFDVDDFKKYTNIESNKLLNEYDLKNSLNFLAKVLHRRYNRKAIVLIDQYDALANTVIFENTTEVDSIFRLFHEINSDFIKYSSDFVRKVYATGTLRVGSPGYAPGDCDFKEYLFLHHHRYTDYYGMDQNEVDELIENHSTNETEIETLRDEIAHYFDGYRTAGNKTMYRVSSVIEYITSKKLKASENSTTFWTKQKCFPLFLRLFYRVHIKHYIVKLLQNGIVTTAKDTVLTIKDIVTLKEIIYAGFHLKKIEPIFDLFFKFLLHLGYLTYTFDSKQETLKLRLPNLEIKKEMEFALIRSVVQEFLIQYNVMDDLNRSVNNISSINYKALAIEKIFKNLTRLTGIQRGGLPTDQDFHATLIAVFRREFHDNVTTGLAKDSDFPFIHLLNKNGISFIISTKVVSQLPQFSERMMQRYTKRLISNLTRLYVNKIDVGRDLRKRVVYMSVCLGVTLYPRGNKPKNCFVGVGYTRDMRLMDDLLGKTVVAEGPFYRQQRRFYTTKKPYKRPTRRRAYVTYTMRTKGTSVPRNRKVKPTRVKEESGRKGRRNRKTKEFRKKRRQFRKMKEVKKRMEKREKISKKVQKIEQDKKWEYKDGRIIKEKIKKTPVKKSVKKPFNKPFNKPFKKPFKKPFNKPFRKPFKKPFKKPE